MTIENSSHSGKEQSRPPRGNPAVMRAKPNPLSRVGKVIGVVSGKGGVGKSLVTALLAALLKKRGRSTAILDADITGPSIPKMFGVHEKLKGSSGGIFPARTKGGISIISSNLLLPDESTPVVWRGPLVSGMVRQFWTDVIWKDIDFLCVDMPPGTGDIPLTVFQSLPVNGILVVTSPQELVSMIVSKAVNMAKMMRIPILGVVENMSYIKCPHCGEKIQVFGKSHTEETARKYGLRLLSRIPLDPGIADACDRGEAEKIESPWLDEAADAVERIEGTSAAPKGEKSGTIH